MPQRHKSWRNRLNIYKSQRQHRDIEVIRVGVVYINHRDDIDIEVIRVGEIYINHKDDIESQEL